MTAQGKAALLELRDRLAKATGPSFELDDALWSMQTGLAAYTEGEPFKAGNSPRRTRLSIPKFTASLDSAVTLVPEDLWWSLCFKKGERGTGRIGSGQSLIAHTPALALCLARLEYELAKEGRS